MLFRTGASYLALANGTGKVPRLVTTFEYPRSGVSDVTVTEAGSQQAGSRGRPAALALQGSRKAGRPNRAHALMFLGRVDEARALYLKYRGQQQVQGDKSWEAVVLEDFAKIQKAGLTHPLMQEIEKAFAGT
jgi:hypothetical protein